MGEHIKLTAKVYADFARYAVAGENGIRAISQMTSSDLRNLVDAMVYIPMVTTKEEVQASVFLKKEAVDKNSTGSKTHNKE